MADSNNIGDTLAAGESFHGRWRSISKSQLSKKLETPPVLVLSCMYPHPDEPGSGNFVLEQVKALRQAGIPVVVISGRPFRPPKTWNLLKVINFIFKFVRAYNKDKHRWWELEGVPVLYLPYLVVGPFWTDAWSYWLSVRLCSKSIIRSMKFDLIHAHSSFRDGAVALLLSRLSGKPFIITEHFGPFTEIMKHKVLQRISLRALKGAAKVLAVSRAQRDSVGVFLPDNVKSNILVVPNVVDTALFSPSPKWHPDPQAPKLLFVGYFVLIKNIPLLMQAFRLVLQQRPRATLTMVGGALYQQEEAINSLATEAVEQGSVKVMGYQSRGEIARLMRDECDILVLSSRSETFGCVVAEALACGKPAVVTQCGGPEDIITSNSLGRICPNEDPSSLAEAILEVSDELENMDSQLISLSCTNRFSSSVVACRLMQIYQDVLQS